MRSRGSGVRGRETTSSARNAAARPAALRGDRGGGTQGLEWSGGVCGGGVRSVGHRNPAWRDSPPGTGAEARCADAAVPGALGCGDGAAVARRGGDRARVGARSGPLSAAGHGAWIPRGALAPALARGAGDSMSLAILAQDVDIGEIVLHHTADAYSLDFYPLGHLSWHKWP